MNMTESQSWRPKKEAHFHPEMMEMTRDSVLNLNIRKTRTHLHHQYTRINIREPERRTEDLPRDLTYTYPYSAYISRVLNS